MKKTRIPTTWVALLLTFYSVQGQGTAFTDKTAFLAALPGPAGILDFDSLAGETDLSNTTQLVSGGPGTGIVFPSAVTDDRGTTLHLQVVANINNNNPTTSDHNSLGTDDGENFNTIIGGTAITFGLTSPVNAFGLSFIIPDEMFNGDIRLAAGSETALLVVDDRTLVGNFSGNAYYAYFLGVVANTAFSSASVQYGSSVLDGPFLYNVDDLTVAVASRIPEPGTPALFLGGLLAAWVWRSRKRPCPQRCESDSNPLTVAVV